MNIDFQEWSLTLIDIDDPKKYFSSSSGTEHPQQFRIISAISVDWSGHYSLNLECNLVHTDIKESPTFYMNY